jgi:ATP-dependent RNA helicase DDX54/DBP10
MDRKKKGGGKNGFKPKQRKPFKGNPKVGRKRNSVTGETENNPMPQTTNDDNDDDKFGGKGFASQMLEMNRKNKKSGGFQSMGLGPEIFRGVIKKGYKVPTPIQRKTIPIILEGRDVVGMARTGSGKTAAFLIPLYQKLMYSASKGVGVAANSRGARALILAPTRELALQVTHKITEVQHETFVITSYLVYALLYNSLKSLA